ncbi:MAG: dUTP diphosphatase [Sphingomonadales bacterium]|nr:dUTP diphosphatase [Sphingomonadales bacterium]PIX65499.1 MAG: dUTP diphosphatase [Sphingomonadales bacterium CG_4_10_14_3_um_filter_58_15]NCO49242.1 dUTP diphosphatase [Sphingomonadales bacterium]NCP01221.1 dUTP diphosphatase [Sphingomonadales bacterium]NCP26645.1 dUTP diphosphatase [Sphingomonadales bacterium]
MFEPIDIAVKRLDRAGDLPLPSYETDGSAGMDVRAADALTIAPGKRELVGTGFAFAIPAGYEIQVRPRSGLALKQGISLPNSPGTIDSDYRGELKVILINHGDEDFVVERGDRIAQIVVAPVQRGILVEVADLDETQRGSGGFGSTGV